MMVDETWRREATSELNFNEFIEGARKTLSGLLYKRPENAEVMWNLWLSEKSDEALKKADAKILHASKRKGSIEQGLSAVTAASAAHALALAQTTDEAMASPLVKATKSLLRSKSKSSESKVSEKSSCVDGCMVKTLGDVETKVLDPSEVLTEQHCNEIEAALSPSCQGHDWKLLYSLSRDGASIDTFFVKTAGHSETLILVKDSHQIAFGGFASKEWKPARCVREEEGPLLPTSDFFHVLLPNVLLA